ncbi:protein THEMIS2 [Lampris incognitus]|uniref:protein THEMIS2 n=1 Tax=Lampris incognitus TaxID=2546036 RepID=UPI0024B524EC|nr:protein THEMIS2 [Lampris incognitus]
MAGTATAMPLQQLIASFDKTQLPKILEVCSGVYYQGSVYELSGTEMCLSTGDLIKVIDTELSSVTCEDNSNNDKFELPINYRGLFKMVPEDIPYSTVEEMLSLRPAGLGSWLPFTFTSHCEVSVDSITLEARTKVTVLSVEQVEGHEGRVRCHVKGHQGALVEVMIPFSCRGEFYECESNDVFTLKEIMSSPYMCTRRFCLTNATTHNQPLVLSPVYQVQAIMHLRKTVVKFSSNLEVDVVDVTERCKEMNFISPLTLGEVLSQPDEVFPTMAEVLENPENHALFCTSWLPKIRKGCQLVLHSKGNSAMVLASSRKGRKAQQFFLISQQYNGQFKKSPREFKSVYELYVAFAGTPGLTVSVTSNIEEQEEDGIPILSVGDQLEVVRCEKAKSACGDSKGQKQTTEVLVCRLLQDLDENDDEEEEVEKDESEELSLPLYMQCHFVEKISDKKKYRLKDLVKKLTLPVNVKVVSRESKSETDPLCGLTSLRLEEATLEPNIQASLPNSLQHCFGIPARWLSMTIFLTKDPLPWPKEQPPKCQVESVTEVTQSFYYEFCKRTSSGDLPPPLPPKPNQFTSSNPSKKASSKPSKKKSPERETPEHPPDSTRSNLLIKHLHNMSITYKKRPLAPPPPVNITHGELYKKLKSFDYFCIVPLNVVWQQLLKKPCLSLMQV